MSFTIEEVSAGDTEALDAVRRLWRAYWKDFDLSPCFQGFEDELRGLPGKYARPGGRLLLARSGAVAVATIGFRPFNAESCEAKRLYVDPAYRGQGIARALLAKVMDEARASGYRAIIGDTLPAMATALDLYRRIGFVETGPYHPDPTPGAIYLRLEL